MFLLLEELLLVRMIEFETFCLAEGIQASGSSHKYLNKNCKGLNSRNLKRIVLKCCFEANFIVSCEQI